LHVDQNPINKVLSIQGAYNHFKVHEHDAGFIIVPKSHLGYNPSVKHSKDWIILSQNWRGYGENCDVVSNMYR